MTLDRSRLSIVVPVFNEEELFHELVHRLQGAIPQFGFEETEIVVVSDGSTDRTNEMLEEVALQDPRIHPIMLSRNFGHQAAVATGLRHATGTVIAIIDGDLQDPPEVIGDFITALEDGAEVAFGVRTHRKENLFKRASYATFYRLMRAISDIEIPLDSGDFCCVTREVLDAILSLPEHNLFLRGIRAWVGFRQAGVPYERDVRFAGAPKYTLKKLFGLAFAGMFSFSRLPIRLMQLLGFCASLVSFGVGAFYICWYLIDRTVFPSGFATLTVSIWFLGGVQLLFLGLVGEYVVRTFDEARRRPISIVKRRHDAAEARSLERSDRKAA